MSKHTPELWETADINFNGYTPVFIGPYLKSGKTGGRLISLCTGSKENALANANLITTAVNSCFKLNPNNPIAAAEALVDMYEALKSAVVWLTETPEGKAVPQINGEPGLWLSKANAAISKVKGA